MNKISIILPTYNSDNVLENAIKSAANNSSTLKEFMSLLDYTSRML